MEIYRLENDKLTLQDPELGLAFEETFAPIRLPEPIMEQTLANGYVVKIDHEQAYIEKDGLLDGQCLFFYPSGVIKMELFYCKGELHGPSTFLNEEKSTLSRTWFIRGRRQGKSWCYYPSGSLYSLQQFKDGTWHGKQQYYYPDGKIKTLMNYFHGKLVGVTQLFNPDGQLKREINH